MRKCQNYFTDWKFLSDILEFAQKLPKYKKKKTFLMMMSAVCWCVCKHKNELYAFLELKILKPRGI